jgi:hypothetical protein
VPLVSYSRTLPLLTGPGYIHVIIAYRPLQVTLQSPLRNLDPGVNDLGISPALNNGGGGDAAEIGRPRLISSPVLGDLLVVITSDPASGVDSCGGGAGATEDADVDVGAGLSPGPGDTGRLAGMAETETGRKLGVGTSCPDCV